MQPNRLGFAEMESCAIERNELTVHAKMLQKMLQTK